MKIQNILLIGCLCMLVNMLTVSSQITSTIEHGEDCTYRWFCTDWIPEQCPSSGIQTRTCTNAGDCPDDYQKPLEERGCEYMIPKQLFDIKLELEQATISTSKALVAWVRFESFGTEPTPVDLEFTILDNTGNQVYSKTDSIVVETEKFVVERFTELNLEYGNYILVLNTLYGDNVKDEFRQGFEIKNPRQILNYFIIGFLALIIVIALLRFFSERRKKK